MITGYTSRHGKQESEDGASVACLTTKVWLKGTTLIYAGSKPAAPFTASTISTISCLLSAMLCGGLGDYTHTH